MFKKKIRALVPLLTGIAVIVIGAFIPREPEAAWWCTAYSIVCGEAVEEAQSDESPKLELHWLIKDIAEKLAERGKH